MAGTPIRSVALDYSKLKIDHEDYAEKTHAEARQAIKKILDLANFAIATEDISGEVANRQLDGAGLADKTPSRSIVHGVTWVMANVDDSDDTGKIKYGQPVVFDTKTGKCVTGINPSWAPSEYKILGTALDNLDSDQKLIPVHLKVFDPPQKYYGEVVAVLRENLTAPKLVGMRPIFHNGVQNGEDFYSEDICNRSGGGPGLSSIVVEIPSAKADLFAITEGNGKPEQAGEVGHVGNIGKFYYIAIATNETIYNTTPWKYYSRDQSNVGQFLNADIVVVEKHNDLWLVDRPKGWRPFASFILDRILTSPPIDYGFFPPPNKIIAFKEDNGYGYDTFSSENKYRGDFTTLDSNGQITISSDWSLAYYKISYSLQLDFENAALLEEGVGDDFGYYSVKVWLGNDASTSEINPNGNMREQSLQFSIPNKAAPPQSFSIYTIISEGKLTFSHQTIAKLQKGSKIPLGLFVTDEDFDGDAVQFRNAKANIIIEPMF